jgi:hypothetical protein
MAVLNKSDQPAAKTQPSGETSLRVCEENTTALKKINQKISHLLDRLPLNSQSDVVEANRLIEEQQRLIRVTIKGHCPVRIETLNENERYRATHLNRRFREAQRSGKIRNSHML